MLASASLSSSQAASVETVDWYMGTICIGCDARVVASSHVCEKNMVIAKKES